MKSQLTLTLVAVVMTSLAGCNGMPRCFSRGDSCQPACGPYEGAEMSNGPALMAPAIIPQRPTDLPGPVMGSAA